MKSGAPKMNIGLVDVRDVAEAHFAAGFRADNSKIKKELEIAFRPMKESMEEAFQALVDNHFFQKK